MWDIREVEAYKLLADLVAIDSTNPSLVPGGAGEQRIAEYIARYLKEAGFESHLDEVQPGRPNVIGLMPGLENARTGRHGLIINGHTDTVSTAGMAYEPLVARREGDDVHGRGSVDMKGGLVMGILAMMAVKRAGARLRKSVLFTGVVDEEYASIGSEDVARRYKADAAVITEPSGLSLTVAHKGFAWVSVATLGKAAHGSRYSEGIDAIAKMGKMLVSVEDLGKAYLKEAAHPLCGHKSIHASLIEGGTELSTYPAYCKAQFERRTLPGEDPAGIAAELESICGALKQEDPQFQAEVTLDFTRDAYEVSRDQPVVVAIASAFKEVVGEDIEFGGGSGWMDSALLGAAGIPTAIFGPGGKGGHSREESVSMRTILTGAQVLAKAILAVCGS
ncbi:MAG: ArgE/DapE family deacylase [Bacillota bacterium]|jgi:acetylornithine deacetylase|nr:ArgE/DapE family deacylase [Bacillota bacterium]